MTGIRPGSFHPHLSLGCEFAFGFRPGCKSCAYVLRVPKSRAVPGTALSRRHSRIQVPRRCVLGGLHGDQENKNSRSLFEWLGEKPGGLFPGLGNPSSQPNTKRESIHQVSSFSLFEQVAISLNCS